MDRARSPVARALGEDGLLCNWIGGAWRPVPSEEGLEVINPATEELLARVPLSGAAEVEEAVAAAAAAFPAWRETPVVERARSIFRLKALLDQHLEELAALVSLENGKTLAEARGEVRRGIEVAEFASGMPSLMMGDAIEGISPGIDSTVHRYPLGPVVGVCPFNFPAMIPLWMIPIALAAGNTFILKPSERTPLSAVRLAQLLQEAGIPEGVFNLVHGAGETASRLITHPGVKAVSFVGSRPVAAQVYATAAAAGKRVQALGGAKNHLIVMPDCHLEKTRDAILASAFGNAGERCLAGSVVVAVGEVADGLVDALAEGARGLRLGSGTDPEVQMGPLIRRSHCRRVEGYLEAGLAEGATLVLDGRRATRPERGIFLGPSIFDHVRPEMSIAREEIFGPVLAVIRASSLDEAIEIVNRSEFGNAASIFTGSGGAARTFRSRIEAGMLGVNVGVPAPMAFFPFTGWKGSFYGDLHATGRDAVEFYTEKKVTVTRWW